MDEGIASVVEALNRIPRLHTIASCQGNDEYHEASVWLRFGDWMEKLPEGRPILYDQAEFYCWFHRELFKRIPPENHKLTVDGVVGTNQLDFKLKFDNRVMEKMAAAIREIAAHLFLPGGRP
ncbi:hypothetical protein SCE1572_43520 [Sorangium cellulosum So0157-2]|uniref:Uncharacterized protein n=1 Tax=Sorangium cellulosum So0157-2 TaxID=1254432 RepID=S4YD71_SORCE|nr:hypothetical protein SCE1572_43520 [Sorangium cellulosum So0157-2]